MALGAKATIIVRKPPAEVFEVFDDPAQMGRFWFHRKDLGFKEGETVKFYMDDAPDAFSFDVTCVEYNPPLKLAIDWDGGTGIRRVTWTFEETDSGDTHLTIVESGFDERADGVTDQVLDSTGGFNQVIVAAKALAEHGTGINLIADHG